MTRKPEDLLEFLLHRSGEAVPPQQETTPEAGPAAPPRHGGAPHRLAVRTSQVAVAAAAVGLLLVLAFMLGRTTGGGAPRAAAPAWVIRVATFRNDEDGRRRAQLLAQDLSGAGPVRLYEIAGARQLVVTIGRWERDPRQAQRLLEKIRRLPARESRPLEAVFWRPPR